MYKECVRLDPNGTDEESKNPEKVVDTCVRNAMSFKGDMCYGRVL